MFRQIYHYTKKYRIKILLVSIILVSLVLGHHAFLENNVFEVILILVINVVAVYGIAITNTAQVLSTHNRLKLKKKFIYIFSLVSILPTFVVVVFSIYLFHQNVQAWFNNKITNLLEQSSHIAEVYNKEHVMQLKETAVGISDDMEYRYKDFIYDSQSLTKVLEGEAEFRSLDEAIIFQKHTNHILAQSALSFSISFTKLPHFFIEKADQGELVEIRTDPNRIRILTKLRGYDDIYLLIGRLIDHKVIKYIDQTNGTVKEYMTLKDNINALQYQLSLAFILFSSVIILIAIYAGYKFASSIVSRLQQLVHTTDEVAKGNLTLRIKKDKSEDEISYLSNAFGSMIVHLDHQNRDLAIAQRAQAWSDIARKVAHEIKNPLTPINLSTEMLARKFGKEVSDPEKLYSYTKTILRHTEDIRKIVSDFVNFARMPTPCFKKEEIISIIDNTVLSRKDIFQNIKYKFKYSIKTLFCVCDATQINQVMLNVLKNAEEALTEHNTKDPEIITTLNVEYKELNIEKITLSISDNGPGFDEKYIEQITAAYFTTRRNGTGLGLAIVKKIIEDHCGTLTILNNKDYEPSNKKVGGVVVITLNYKELNSMCKTSGKNLNYS